MLKKLTTLPKKIVRWILRHWKLLLIILAALIGLGYWQYSQTQAQKPALTFVKPWRGNLTRTLEVSGVVDAKEKARLRFAAGGKITYLGANEGDWVKQWQTIATVDRAALQKQLEQDLNNYMKERWDWEQTQDNIEDRWIPVEESRTVDQERWDLENQALNVEIRDIAIQNTVLNAPFAGILTTSPTNVTGVQLLASDYFEIINPESLVFKAAVDEIDIGELKAGQLAEIEMDAYENESLSSYVDFIAYTSSQSSTGTVFVVEFPLPSQDVSRYRLGMNGDISVNIDNREDVLIIPLDATRQRDGKTYVDVKTGEDTYQERAIETGLEADTDIEVISGLDLNDEILLPE